ncbi:right-handed parallel beta-helix repeat-containing protein [Candidatus Woesearchaeota archaeon]|nr:right-handed parallel beta-helix repeat-containing protein [Candidatus Woesearchaeota archaeon]
MKRATIITILSLLAVMLLIIGCSAPEGGRQVIKGRPVAARTYTTTDTPAETVPAEEAKTNSSGAWKPVVSEKTPEEETEPSTSQSSSRKSSGDDEDDDDSEAEQTPASSSVQTTTSTTTTTTTTTTTPPSTGAVSADLSKLVGVVTHADLSALPSDVTDYSSYTAYYVSASGSDSASGSMSAPWATISHALESVQSGSVVYVRGGTYKTGMLSVAKSDIVLAAYPGESVVLQRAVVDNSWSMFDDLAFNIEGDIENIVVDGFTVDGFPAGIIYGDSATQKNLIFKNLVIKDATNVGVENTYPSHSSYLVDGLMFKNVTIQNVNGIGIQCGDENQPCAKNVLLQNVKVIGATGQGDDTGYDTLAMVSTDNVLVLDSYFANSPGDGLDFKATRVSVVNTVAASPNRNGMKFWHDGEMINCLVYRTGADAAVVTDGQQNKEFRIINSIIAQHNYDGGNSYAITFNYDSGAAASIVLKNNIFYDMPGPIYANSASTLDVENNIFYDFRDDNLFDYKDGYDASDLNSQSWASGNIFVDPLFVSASKPDLTLSSGTPAKDAGVSGSGVPGFDINWKTRPAGSSVDIGPYEN